MGDQMYDEEEHETYSSVFSYSRATPDSATVANLLVFPNRHFSDGWETHADIPSYDHAPRRPPRAMAQIRALLEGTALPPDEASRLSNLPKLPETQKQWKDACSGWIATYDVFSIENDQQTRTTSIEVKLSRFDVELCLRQGLCADEEEWICAFPLSISPNFEMFTVLHNLVYVDKERLFPQVISLHWTSAQRWKTWTKLKSVGDKELTADRPDIYRHQFTWSPDGKYLLFHDLQLQPLAWVENGTCAVVFAISNRPDGQKRVGVVNHFPSVSLSTGIHDCQFHPTEALLLFRDELKSYVWRFLKDSRPMVLDLDRPGGQLASLVDRISFSTCGGYLAVSRLRAEWPELIDLGDLLNLFFIDSPSSPGDASTASVSSNDTSGPRVSSSTSSLVDAQGVTLRNPQTGLAASLANVLTSRVYLVSKDDDGEVTVTTCVITQEGVELRQNVGGIVTTTPLLNLPPFIPKRYLEVQVTAPDVGDDVDVICKIVLNAGPRKAFLGSSSVMAAANLPIVLRRVADAFHVVLIG